MALLEAQICDVWGTPIAGGAIYHTTDGGGLEVTDPINDSRTAQLTLSAYDRAARAARPLDRVLSVTYGDHLLFKGYILQVSTDFAAGTVQVAAHDPTIKLKHHYHRFGDLAVEAGYRVDGKGMRVLIESSLEPIAESESGIPPNGILWGHNSATHRPTVIRSVKRGTNVWESVVNLSKLELGPDFRFRPVDKYHLGVYPAGILPSGFMVELDTSDQLGTDKSGEIIFEHGLGEDNAENVTHDPDGDLVRNHFTQVYPGGQRNRADDLRRAEAFANGSIHDYGLMEGYESSGQADTQALLKEKARTWVRAYARPPDFFTVEPRIRGSSGSDSTPTYPRDIKVGDYIRARARKGERDFDSIGRVTRAQVNSIDQAGNARLQLECVPLIDDEIGDD